MVNRRVTGLEHFQHVRIKIQSSNIDREFPPEFRPGNGRASVWHIGILRESSADDWQPTALAEIVEQGLRNELEKARAHRMTVPARLIL